ncbi:MAG: hypothetical protein WC535_02495 [Candidatus Cloacimonas sp.]|jgi:hypothetical protein|nr:hypothetical protein [Candidatus Cloacimonas sp.]
MSWILRQHLELSFKKSQMYTGQNQVERMMKKYWFCLFYLLLMVVPLLGIPFEQTEEYNQKQAILNERAARFKAETGFVGDISYNLQGMQFSTISGSFKEIEVTAPQDTVFMRSVFDHVVSKVMPYISAREGQLSCSKVRSNINGSGVIYWQNVNGYSIEGGGGSLRIHYSLATYQLSVNNGTVDISSDPVSINLTLEQAISLVQEKVFDGAEVKPTNPRIAYVPIDNENGQAYYLCHILTNQGYTVFVDVSEPIIRKVAPNLISRSFNVNILGNVYNGTYTDIVNIPLSQQSMGSVLVQTPIDSLFADHFFVNALINDVLLTEPLRYKPRYFYNALMKNSNTPNQSINNRQGIFRQGS